MGCGSSKVDDLPLVSLCRERKELIRAASDLRFALASAHVSYFRSLAGVGEALHRFVHEELTVMPSPMASPVLSLPPFDQKRKNKSNSKSEGSNGNNGGNGDVASSSSSPLSHSLSPQGSHLHFSSPSDADASQEEGGGGRESSSYPPHHFAFPSPDYYYMRSSTAIPSMVYEDPYGSNYYDRPMMDSSREDSASASIPPPPPEGSNWDFLNPFDSYEQFLPGHYKGRYGIGSDASSPNSSEVREREGIPDLEDETEQEPVKKVDKGKKVVGGDLGGRDSGVGSSKGAWTQAQEKDEIRDTEVKEEKGRKISPEASTLKSSGDEEGGHTRKKTVSFEDETLPLTEDSGSSNGTALSSHGTRDVFEAVKEIKDQFTSAACCGEEVSKMLEVGKLRYRSRNRIFRVISSRIWDPMVLPLWTPLHPSFKRSRNSASSMLKMAKARNADSEKYIGMKSGNLSSTLEKLYVWEKKLFKEVKDEEKLRVIYDKKCRRLKALDDRGAEPSKIDSTRASVRKLRTKISIVIKSVDAISNRIHKLRDEELQPQLIELIQGLIRMWKSVLDCHQKQFHAVFESKSHYIVAKTVNQSSGAKATKELELELLNWCSCFNNWVSTQKAYIRALNGWLIRWLPQEQEETDDGVVPFSPSRLEAPAVFIISNDWYNAFEKIPDVQVTTTMHTFAASVHNLWERQNEEQRHKLRAEYLSKELSRRLKSLERESGIHRHVDESENAIVSVSNDGGAYPNDHTMALDSLRKRLDEERAKHEETVKQVQEAASSSLRTGLIPIFEALGNFSSEALKAHERVRISNVGEGT